MKVMISIPTWKTNVDPLINEIKNSVKDSVHEIVFYATCINQSASKNRNLCIDTAKERCCDILVQCDDDIKIVQNNWLDNLINPLIEHKDKIAIIAPRLVTDKGIRAAQLGDTGGTYDGGNLIENNDMLKIAWHTKETKLPLICSACIGFFVEDCARYDENIPFACFEDSDMALSMIKKHPNKHNVINSGSQIVHNNHSTWRRGNKWSYNRNYFNNKWNVVI